MQLTDSSGLWLLGLLVPLFLLYLFRFRSPTIVVSSLELWSLTQVLGTSRKPRRKFHWVSSLLLQLLALCALALAASGPTSHALVPAKQVALVIDTSASMQTQDERGHSRLDLAKTLAKDFIDGLHPDTDVMLLSATESVGVVTGFERDRPRLRRELDALAANDVRGRLQPALELAVEKLQAASGEQLLVVITDGVLAERMLPQPEDVEMRVMRVGRETDNLAITQVDVRSERARDGQQLSPTLVFASVKNFSESHNTVELTLRQRNVTGVLAARELHLRPGEERPTTLEFLATAADEGAGLVLELTPGDALAVDDRAYAVVPRQGRQVVALIGDHPSPWLERALAADTRVELVRLKPDAPLDEFADDSLLIFLRHCPRVDPRSSFLIVAPPSGPCLTTSVGAELESPEITHWEDEDVLFRFVAMGELQLSRARSLSPESRSEALLWSRETPLMTRVSLRDVRGTMVGFDFERTNWPLSASFVLFVRNLVDLARENGQQGHPGTTTGKPIRVQVPRNTSTVQVEGPQGSRQELTASSSSALLPRASRSGFYYFSWAGSSPGSSLVAVNLTNADESDPVVDPLPIARAEQTAATEFERPEDMTPWLALLALLAVLGDIVLMTTATLRPRRSHP